MLTVKGRPVQLIQVSDAEALAGKACDEIISSAKESLKTRGRFCLAISGGHTPMRTFQWLSQSAEARGLDWERIHLFWVDERSVPPDDQNSNYRMASETFLKTMPIPAGNVHRMRGESKDLTQAAHEYEQVIREVFQLPAGQIPAFDLILLGMGENGHIASLMPNSYALFDTKDLVSTVFQMEGDWSRLTLTVPVLRAAKKLIVLISGAEKASIVQTVFSTEADELKYPAHALWPVLDKVIWIIDKEAAGLLP